MLAALETALELTHDTAERAGTYVDLAYESSVRSGMWRTRPARELMETWTSRALAGTPEGSAAQAKALIGRVFWGFPDSADAAPRALEIARALEDPALESGALDALGVFTFRTGDFERAYELEASRFALRPHLNDPDLVHDLFISTIPTAAAAGQLDEAKRLADELQDVVAELTPHHRLHGSACRLELDELVGAWDEVVAREAEVEHAVLANRDTPCVRNARSLLVCALGRQLVGDDDRSGELEALAEDIKGEGHGAALATPRARLALARGRLDLLEELLADDEWLRRQSWFALPAAAARLDVLSIVGTEADVEAAGAFGPSGSYVEPFALRALGIVRADEALLQEGQERFDALGLTWHAEQTDMLRRLRQTAS